MSKALICKRCGKPLVGIEYKRRGNRVYAYGLHREVLPDGRIKWYYHYLGPTDRYVEVSKLHEDVFPQGLYGYTYELEGGSRRIDYLRGQVKAIKDQVQRRELPAKEALELAGAIEELSALVGELRQYAEEKAKEEAEEAKEGEGQ